jgi:LuxR family maltose regulon positive regulatory protein
VVAVPYPLLATKFYLPAARPSIVWRPRLTGRLAAGLRCPLTLISAPAGFGKTTLLSEWRATPDGQAHPLAWLSLDPGDNDPTRFWAYVLAALRTVPQLEGLPDELDAGVPPDLALAPLINSLEGAAAAPVILVLDDYHTITAPAIHTALSFLVEHMPAGLRLVVLTRSDPAWPMARLRAHGQLSELRAADLRFTTAEAAEFFAEVAGLDLAPADLATVAQRTEGWIAALKMVAISLNGHPDPHGFVAAFSGEDRYVTDYLTEEVLARQPEELRRFLLRASVLDRLSAPLCMTVTEAADSRTWLDQLDRAALFLVPLDPERRWFRFHHLFGDLLRAHLRQTEPELIPILHGRAAAWCAENGLPLDAARHYVGAHDYDRTVQLIEQHAGGWWNVADADFGNLLQQLPPAVIRRSPLLCAYAAFMDCMRGEMESAADLVDAALSRAPLPADIASSLALTRTFIAELSGQPYTLAEPVLRAPEYIPVQANADLRNSADLALAFILYMNGKFDRAGALWLGAAEREVARRTAYVIPVAIPLLARMWLIEGKVAEAVAILRRYVAIMQERGEARFFVAGNVRAVLADVLRLQGDLAEAEAQAQQALRINQAYEIHHALVMPLHALARIRLAQGDGAGALELLDAEVTASGGLALAADQLSDRAAMRVQAWLATGNLDAAAGWARESGLSAHDPLSFRTETLHMALARVLLAAGRQAEAEQLLTRLERTAQAAGRLGRLAEIRRLSQEGRPPQAGLLSEREREILRLIAEGRSNQEIAKSLVVAVGTVKTHVHHLLEKLEAESRTQAIARARELRLLK